MAGIETKSVFASLGKLPEGYRNPTIARNLDREERGEQLNLPSDNLDAHGYATLTAVMRREPITYRPQSASCFNAMRLPSLATLRTMALAFREQFFSDAAIEQHRAAMVPTIILLTVLYSTGIIVIGTFAPLAWMLYAAPISSVLFLLFSVVVMRTAKANLFLLIFVAPIVMLVVVYLFSLLIYNRLVAWAVVAAITWFMVNRVGHVPIDFYLRWLFAHPRLRPETRAAQPPAERPDMGFLVIVLVAAGVIPALSTTLAVVLIVLLCVGKIMIHGRIRPLLMMWHEILRHAFTYGAASSAAPGMWVAPMDQHRRMTRFVATLSPLTIALFVGLGGYYPDRELLGPELASGVPVSEAVRARPPTSTTPKVDKTDAAARPEKFDFWSVKGISADMTRGPFDWIPHWQESTVRSPLPFFVLFGSVACIFLIPPLVLFAVHAKSIKHAMDLRNAVEGGVTPAGVPVPGLDEDGRTEWEWYTDRIKDSPHEARDPQGATVREAEHLFLGVEPGVRFPVLLDKNILAEHAYIVGDSGSGKTSLGLMPILIQLLRGNGVWESSAKEELTRAACIPDLRRPPHIIEPAHEQSHLTQLVARIAAQVAPTVRAVTASSIAASDNDAGALKGPPRGAGGAPNTSGEEPGAESDRALQAATLLVTPETLSAKQRSEDELPWLAKMIVKLMRSRQEEDPELAVLRATAALRQVGRGPARTPCVPMVVIDLKGDSALFHTVKEEAEARGQEFRFFTPERGRASHCFNPFESLAGETRTDIQLANLMLDALSLNHGEGYGRSYYTRQSRRALALALRHSTKPRSFEEMYQTLKEMEGGGEAPEEIAELISTIEALQHYPMLAVKHPPERPELAIHMPTVLERRQVVYYWLPAAVESVSVREIAKLALYSILTACIDRQRSGPQADQRQCYLVIDEFQRIAGDNFRVILEQARSFGLSVILSNQSVGDLVTPDVDLRPTIRANTRFKRYFSVTDPEAMKELSVCSGEELVYMRSWTQSDSAGANGRSVLSRTDAAQLKPRLTINDILLLSDHPLDSIVHVSRGSGYTQFGGVPIPVRCTYPMTQGVYARRLVTPWPDFPRGDNGNSGVVVSDKSPVDIDRERDRKAAEKAFEMMQELLVERA